MMPIERRIAELDALAKMDARRPRQWHPSQRTGYTKRRKQIWEALHPVDIEVAQAEPPQFLGQLGGARPQTQGFAAATAEATGQSKATTNRAIARADALGDDALAKVANTSLDSGVELDALAKMDAPER